MPAWVAPAGYRVKGVFHRFPPLEYSSSEFSVRGWNQARRHSWQFLESMGLTTLPCFQWIAASGTNAANSVDYLRSEGY